MPYSWGRDPLSNFEIRLDDATAPPGPALTVAFTVAADGRTGQSPGCSATDRPRSGRGRPRRGPCRPTWRSRPARHRLLGGRGPLQDDEPAPGDRLGAHSTLRQDLGEDHEVGTSPRQSWPGSPTSRCRPASPAGLLRRAQRRLRRRRRRHRHRPHGTRLRRGRPAGVRAKRTRIVLVCPVDDSGRFTAEVPDYEGQNVFDANPNVLTDLKAAGVVVRHDTYEHNYPHCWRTDTRSSTRPCRRGTSRSPPSATGSSRLNQDINWIPSTCVTASSASGSRAPATGRSAATASAGSPIPVWRSDDPYPRLDVYGSLAEIEADWRPPRRPAPPDRRRAGPAQRRPTGRSMMRRVPEVFDCWFESVPCPRPGALPVRAP